MKRSIWAVFIATAVAACGGGGEPADDGEPTGAMEPGTTSRAVGATGGEWDVLFDGSSLERWQVVGGANWTLENGAVRADGSTTERSYLVSDVDYRDFDLSLEFWVDVPANSGVFIRCRDDDERIGAETCYEVNIFDTRPDPTYRTGGVVNFQAPAEHVNAGGRWNRYAISAHGNRLTATLNDVEMFDFEDDTYASGPIALQYGSGTVMFRNVRIRTP